MRLPFLILIPILATFVAAVPGEAQQGAPRAGIIKMQSEILSENISTVNNQPSECWATCTLTDTKSSGRPPAPELSRCCNVTEEELAPAPAEQRETAVSGGLR